RWNYSVDEENMEGDNLPSDTSSEGYSFLFNSKDLCTIKIIDKLLDLGIDSLKIEGRMKGIYYVANVVKVYKDALNSYYSPKGFQYNPQWLEELESTSHRSYSTGFLQNKPTEEAMNYRDRNSYSQTHQLVAKVIEKISDTEFKLAIRNRLQTGEVLEVINPTFGIKTITLPEMRLLNKKDEEIVTFANPNSTVIISLPDTKLEVFDMIRKCMN
ncbi:MAG: peptidase U32 family protein, partial [Fusobacteriaceae bacterium]